jgi:Xaa-Pro aminopeptidase
MLRPEARVSRAEMNRRHDLVRRKMKQAGLSLLVVSGLRFIASTGYLRYLTNWAEPFSGEILLFPIEGEPLFCARTADRACFVERIGVTRAIIGCTPEAVATQIRKIGTHHVGICGLKTMMADFYVQLGKELPGIELVDYSELMDDVRMIKSPEELQWVKRSASLGDSSFRLFESLVEEGREEAEVFVEVEHLIKRMGAESVYFMMAAEPQPVTKFADLACERYKRGDLVIFNAEIAGPAGYYSQLVRMLSLGKPTAEAAEAARACIKAMEIAERTLRPGVSSVELYEAIRAAVEKSGHKLAHDPGHSQGLDSFERPFLNGRDDVTLKEGMVMIVHPHVRMRSGGGMWFGDTFVVTAGGCENLSRVARDLVVL